MKKKIMIGLSLRLKFSKNSSFPVEAERTLSPFQVREKLQRYGSPQALISVIAAELFFKCALEGTNDTKSDTY